MRELKNPRPGEPCVSVVIVSWNTCDLLESCLGSLRSAVEQTDLCVQTIVVDNASSDASTSMVHREFPTVELLTNRANRGFAAATNQGIERAKGKYILLLNPDTVVPEGTLKSLLDYAEAHPGVGITAPKLLGENGAMQVSFYPFPTVAKELWRLLHLDHLVPLAIYRIPREPRSMCVDSVQGACMLIRREVLDEVGSLDERFFIYSEEIDLCRRVRGAGWEIHWYPEAWVVHMGGRSTRQIAPQMFLQLYTSKVQYFRKYGGQGGVLLYKLVLAVTSLPRMLLAPLVAAARPAQRQELRAIHRNYRTLLARLPIL